MPNMCIVRCGNTEMTNMCIVRCGNTDTCIHNIYSRLSLSGVSAEFVIRYVGSITINILNERLLHLEQIATFAKKCKGRLQ